MRVDSIKCAGADERFHHAAVDNPLVHTMAKIEQIVKGSVLPSLDNRLQSPIRRCL